LENVDVYDADKILAEKEAILERINQAQIPKLEKQDMERFLRPLKDVIAEKKEKALLALSEDDRQKLEHLKELLSEKKERWQEIKSQLNVYRKAKGASGLDFEQAMNNSQMIEAEKERLEKITLSIKELEEMIEKIGGLD
jgi:predicted ATP-grasp superfamily ATP-dependent carboligase